MLLEFVMAFLPVIIALGQFYMAQQLHQHQHLQLQNQIVAAAIAQREEQDDRRPRQARRFKRHRKLLSFKIESLQSQTLLYY